MTDKTEATETKAETKAEPKQDNRGRPPKSVEVKNNTARPITLIGTSKAGDRVTILPTQTAEIDGKLWAILDKNKAVATYFDSGELTKV